MALTNEKQRYYIKDWKEKMEWSLIAHGFLEFNRIVIGSNFQIPQYFLLGLSELVTVILVRRCGQTTNIFPAIVPGILTQTITTQTIKITQTITITQTHATLVLTPRSYCILYSCFFIIFLYSNVSLRILTAEQPVARTEGFKYRASYG